MQFVLLGIKTVVPRKLFFAGLLMIQVDLGIK